MEIVSAATKKIPQIVATQPYMLWSGTVKKILQTTYTVIEIMAHQTQNFSFMVFSFTFLILTLDIHPPTLTLI